MGYVRVAFGVLNVESQCSWAVVQSYTAVADMPVVVLKTLLKPVEIPQLQFLDTVEICPLLRRQVQFSVTVVDMPVGVQ